MTSNLRKIFWARTPLFLACGLLLGACGEEYTPSSAQPGALPPASQYLAFRDLTDTTTTTVSLTSSADYDSNLNEVQIYVRAVNQDGVLLSTLNEHNFGVTLEPKTVDRPVDAAETDLTLAVSMARVVGLVMDSSGSMSSTTDTGATRMEVAKEAARLFIGGMSGDDQAAVVDFDDAARTVQSLTRDKGLLTTAVDGFSADGLTNLGGALTEAVRSVGTRPGKRAVVLLTDGDDTVDTVQGGPAAWFGQAASSRNQGLQLALANQLVVFAVGLGDGLSDTGLADLNKFATETGGQFFQAATAAELTTAFSQTIPAAIDALTPTETYLLTFESAVLPTPGKVVDVPYRLSVVYENAVSTHRDKFNGTYTLR